MVGEFCSVVETPMALDEPGRVKRWVLLVAGS